MAHGPAHTLARPRPPRRSHHAGNRRDHPAPAGPHRPARRPARRGQDRRRRGCRRGRAAADGPPPHRQLLRVDPLGLRGPVPARGADAERDGNRRHGRGGLRLRPGRLRRPRGRHPRALAAARLPGRLRAGAPRPELHRPAAQPGDRPGPGHRTHGPPAHRPGADHRPVRRFADLGELEGHVIDSGAQTVEETAAAVAAAIGQDRFTLQPRNTLQPGNSAAVSRSG